MSASAAVPRNFLAELPGLDCGLCGFRTCAELAEAAAAKPELLTRCVQRSSSAAPALPPSTGGPAPCDGCAFVAAVEPRDWKDHLGREYDFVLQTFPEEPGPRETILPHNPLLTRELDIRKGDVLIGRPLGMSCGCPITHCGVVMSVDPRTGVLVW